MLVLPCPLRSYGLYHSSVELHAVSAAITDFVCDLGTQLRVYYEWKEVVPRQILPWVVLDTVCVDSV